MLGHFDAGFTLAHLHPRHLGKNRTRLPKPWVTLWNRSCKDRKKNTPDRKAGFPVRRSCVHCFRCLISACGSRVWVKPLTHILFHADLSLFITKNPRKPRFSRIFGAATQIELADPHPYQLIGELFQPLIFNAFRPFLLQKDEVSCTLVSVGSVPPVSPCGVRVWVKVWVKPVYEAKDGRTSDSGVPRRRALSCS